jgi:hypothetical protein
MKTWPGSCPYSDHLQERSWGSVNGEEIVAMENLVRFPGRKRQVTEDSQRAPRKRIGELLILDGLITEGQLQTALEVQRGQGGRILDRLVMLGYLSAQAVSTFLARQPGVSSIVLSNYMVRTDLTTLIPREYAESRQVFPIDRLGKLLTVGMACPLDDKTIQELEAATGLHVKPMLCSPECIEAAISRHYETSEEFCARSLDPKKLYSLQWAR